MIQQSIEKDPETQEVVHEAGQLITAAQSFRILSVDGYTSASVVLARIKTAMKKLVSVRKRMTDPLDQSRSEIMNFFRDPLVKLETAEAAVKGAMLDYNAAQERLQREAQQKADEAARKQREKLLEQARKADAAGKAEKAALLEVRAETHAAPVIQREVPKFPGVGTRTVWDFQIDDEAKVPREYLTVDEVKIRKIVQAMKGDAKIPGVRVFEKQQIAARGS
jgi:hypothetical protein